MVGRTGRSQLGIFLAPLSPGMKITAEPHNLNVKVQFIENVAWTPDGKELIFSAGPHGYTNLWRVPLAGGDPKQLVAAGLADQATLARDPSGHGMRLVFKRRNRDVNVWQIRMAGGRILGKPVRLIGSTRRDFEPRYSPDGNRIAFSSDRSGSVEVWICDKDGSNAIQMTHFPDGITSGARWSPDSKRLVFLSTVSGQSEIYMMDAQSGPITRLTTDPAHDTAPNWSRDGKWIYFASNRTGMQQIWKMPPEANATPIQVTRHGGIAAIESWDGKTLYYAMQRGGDGIWKVPVEGGEETRVLPTYAGWGNFDVTPKGIVFLPIEPPPGSVWFLPFGGGEPRRMADLERPPDFGLSVSPADGSILYTQVDQDINELAIIENFR
jgi:Tol biopolymer transport system component